MLYFGSDATVTTPPMWNPSGHGRFPPSWFSYKSRLIWLQLLLPEVMKVTAPPLLLLAGKNTTVNMYWSLITVDAASGCLWRSIYFLISSSCLCSSASPACAVSGALLPKAIWQFGEMIQCVQPGLNPFMYNNYGCWCGLGGTGTPLDEVDM